MSELPFAASAPISVGRVGLKARNAKALADYYSAVVGLEQLSQDGGTITLGAKSRPLLVIEHVMRALMELCERIVVLHHGQLIAEGTPTEIGRDAQVHGVYFGGSP